MTRHRVIVVAAARLLIIDNLALLDELRWGRGLVDVTGANIRPLIGHDERQ